MARPNKIIENNKNLKLSIQIQLSGLSFYILNSDTNKIIQSKGIDFEKKLNPFELLGHLKELLHNENILDNSYQEVLVIHINDLSTLVPGPLFDKDSLADYLKFNAKILKSDFIAYDTIEANNSVNVYVPYININNFIYEQFGSFTFKHFSTVLIETVLNIENSIQKINTYVHVGKDHFEIIIVDSGNLKLYNTFQYTTKEDFIYFILFAFEQLNLNPDKDPIILLGDINKDDELYKIVYKYIRHVDFLNLKTTRVFEHKNTANHTDFLILNSF